MKNKRNISIYQKMYEANKNFPHDIAIEYYGKKITFKEFFEKIDIYANAFAELGIENGKKVTVSLFSTPEFMYTFYALNKLGAVAMMISPKYLARNTKRYMEGTESNTLVH